MQAGQICRREVVVAHRDTSLAEAARLMREHHVGSVVVVSDVGGKRVPFGLITDRDIVVAVVAKGLDPRTLNTAEVMSSGLYVANEHDDISDVLRVMHQRGVRRVPVVARDGALVGIVSLDDLLDECAHELYDLVRAIGSGKGREARLRA